MAASDTVRKKVTLRINEGGDTPVQKTNTPTPKSNPTNTTSNLDIIRAATAVYRSQNAPKDKPYTVTDEQKAIFETAQKTLAEKRGIKEDENGKFRKEHLENELSPLEVIKQFSLEHYREKEDNDGASKDIGDIFNEVYSDKKDGQTEDVPEQLSGTNSSLHKVDRFYTDADFLGLDPKAQQEYLESIKDFGAEVDHLTKLLEENQKTSSNDHKAFDLSRDNEDPDAPRTTDKDYKSKQEDIIKWMMEEIILKGLDWIGNRTVDLITTPVYSFAHDIYKGVKDEIKARKSDSNNNNNSGNNNPVDNTNPTNPENNPPSFQETIETLNQQIIKNTELKTISSETFEFLDGLITHNIVLEPDGFIQNGKKTPWEKDHLFQRYKAASEALDNATIEALSKKLKIDNDEEAKKGLTDWFKETVKNIERKAKGEKEEDVKIPDILKQKKFTEDILKEKLKETNEDSLFNTGLATIKDQINDSAEIFSDNYAIYKLIEGYRAAKTDEERKNLDFEKLKEKYTAEGKLLMYQNLQALRNGDEKAMSMEEMLQLSNEMAQTSLKLYNKGDNSSESPNLLEERISPSQTQENPENIVSFIDNTENIIKTELQNLDILQKEEDSLTAQNQDLDDRKKLLNKLKRERTQPNREQRRETTEKIEKIFQKKTTNQHR